MQWSAMRIMHTVIITVCSEITYLLGLTLIPAWISNYIHYTVWDEITLLLKFGNGLVISFLNMWLLVHALFSTLQPPHIISDVTDVMFWQAYEIAQSQGVYALKCKTSHAIITRSLGDARYGFRLIRLFWNLTGASTALLYVSIFKAIQWF